LNDDEFVRIVKYYTALKKFLKDHPLFSVAFPRGVNVVLVCDDLDLTAERQDHFDRLHASGVLLKYNWREFLSKTENAHEDFLNATK
jgi:hypothetical protein